MEKLYKFNKDTLDFEVVSILKYKIIIFILFIFFSLSLISAIKKPEKEYVKTEFTLKGESCEKSIYELIDKYPFLYPDIIKAQSRIETSNFSSEVFKSNNNVFGMRFARQRLTTATDSNLNHAYYESVEESIVDRLLFEAKYMSNLSKEQYYSFLDKHYAEGEGYSTLIKKIINKK